MRTPGHIARATLAGLAGILVLAVTGCAGGGDDKAGGSGAAVTLRMGNADPRGYPASDAIDEFARRVSTSRTTTFESGRCGRQPAPV
jgi:hypothetical protein